MLRVIRGVAWISVITSCLCFSLRAGAQPADGQPDVVTPPEDAAESPATVETEPPSEQVEAAAADPKAPESAASGGDMVVVGERFSEAKLLQESADAVNVIETEQAQKQSADLGEVLARSQGVSVRRAGALGSETKFMLNGLTGEQIRFFLDGVPLELAGFPFGIGNVPVNLVERVEVYRGVVPVRLGADALGGAVNLVTPREWDTSASASYQVGSFGTHRATVNGRYKHAPSGVVVGVTGYLDSAENDYLVRDVPRTAESGRQYTGNARRFHDAYRAYGGSVDVGVIDRAWAKRLLLTGFASTYDKELQHNLDMTRIYGEPVYGDSVYGATARYDVDLSADVELEINANYSHRVIEFRDVSAFKYSWDGRVEHPRAPGELLSDEPTDTTLRQNAAFARVLLSWDVAPEHVLRVSLTPTFASRAGEERAMRSARDESISAARALVTLVSGLEYELNLFDDRLSNVAFLKDYVYHASLEPYQSRDGQQPARDKSRHAIGAGDALRIRFTSWLLAKASYEYAMRLPRPEEVFGSGALVRPNPDLEPEVSHNVNLGPRLQLDETPLGAFVLDVNAFLRESDRLILLLPGDGARHENLYRARSLGVENAASWRSPGDWLSLDGMLTYQDVRNRSRSEDAAFGSYYGDPVPNRPYFFASWSARVKVPVGRGRRDSLEPFYYGRFVHSFYQHWASLGLSDHRPMIPTQTMHDLGASYLIERPYASATATFEVQNVTNAKLYDNYGVQRPGRAFFGKLTASFR